MRSEGTATAKTAINISKIGAKELFNITRLAFNYILLGITQTLQLFSYVIIWLPDTVWFSAFQDSFSLQLCRTKIFLPF
jgi:hypothetical protein